jgi:hypothetical protein
VVYPASGRRTPYRGNERVYQFSDEDLNQNQFFRFNEKWILNMNWALLPLASKAVLPVIYAYDNRNGQSWPSETTIAALTGLSCKTVRKGVDGLLNLPGFSYDWQMTATGRKSKKFKFNIPGKGDPVFFFHKIIMTGGNWRLLKPISKTVYPVLRAFSAWDAEEENDIIDSEDGDYKAAYAARIFEYSEAKTETLAKFSGIARQNVPSALRDLQKHFLLERQGERWKVFLKPPQQYERAWLNEQLMKSFACELRRVDGLS